MEMGNMQRDSNPTKEQTTAEGHQRACNVARKSRTQKWSSTGPSIKLCTRSVKMDVSLKS